MALLFRNMETWQIVLGLVGLLVSVTSITFTVALRSFGGAFKHWGDKFDSFQVGVNKRLDHIEATFTSRLHNMEGKLDHHDEKYHGLTLHIERRMTWLEATMKNHPSGPSISPESPLVRAGGWTPPKPPPKGGDSG